MVDTADKKPQNFRDPKSGKLKVRMVPTDTNAAKDNVKEETTKMSQPTFFQFREGLQGDKVLREFVESQEDAGQDVLREFVEQGQDEILAEARRQNPKATTILAIFKEMKTINKRNLPQKMDKAGYTMEEECTDAKWDGTFTPSYGGGNTIMLPVDFQFIEYDRPQKGRFYFKYDLLTGNLVSGDF